MPHRISAVGQGMACRLIAVTGVALLGAMSAAPAPAQGWQPDKPVEIAVPTTAGAGSADHTARMLQKILQENELVKVPITVVNKPGAGGAVSLAYLNQHSGDGHYISVNTPNLIANDITGRSPVRYTEVTALANLFSVYTVIAVRTDSPVRTGQDFVDRLRKDAGSLAVSTPTTLGSVNHMSLALIAKAGGVDVKKLKAVILGSGGDAVTQLLGGHIDAHAGTQSSVVRMVEAGKLRVIGILAPRRVGGVYADTPTWQEQGYPAVMDTWRGVIGPKGMTRGQIEYWDAVLAKVVATEVWKREIERNMEVANYLDSSQTRKLFDANYAQYQMILRDLGLIK